jgi:hypothetical protein
VNEFKLANIKKMTEEELTLAIENCFEEAPEVEPVDRLAYLMEAQFYQTELDWRQEERDRRHDSRVEWRSFGLEIAVIVLILGEIILSVYGIRLPIKEAKDDALVMDRQNNILSNLQTSTQTTASMLGEELDLEYTLAINVEYSGYESVTVFNNSRSEAILGGVSVDGVVGRIRQGRPFVIADHNMVSINLSEYNPKLRKKGTGNTKPFIFPIEIYISNVRGKEFVWKGRVTWGNSSGPVSGVPNGQLVTEPWAPEIKPAISQVPSAIP